jgi:hypothetical protein
MPCHRRVLPLPRETVTVWVLAAVVACCAIDAPAQVVSGRVLDAETDAGIPQVTLAALNGGSAVASAIGDSLGNFSIRVAGPGTFVIRASRVGYATETLTVEVFSENESVVLRLAPLAVPIDPLAVTARRGRIPREASIDGLYARRQWVFPVGSERVLVRGDPEFDNSPRVIDVLRWFRTARACVVYFVNGMPHPPLSDPRDFVETMPTSHLEGIEFYREQLTAPLDYQGYGCWNAPLHSIIAVWFRH